MKCLDGNYGAKLLIQGLLLASGSSAENTASTDADPSLAPTGSNIVSKSECNDWGFDPSNLSCDTCSLLSAKSGDGSAPLASFVDDCLKCCQTFRPNPVINPDAVTGSFVGRYQIAVLKYDPDILKNYDEIQNFLKEDKEDVMKEKGNEAFLIEQKQEDHRTMKGYGNFMGMFRSMYSSPTIYFYKEIEDASKGTEAADEEVNLQGFKREDIKDMLLTVLPSRLANKQLM